ncbi:MAG TPA: hypothetical protein VF549_04105 [Solirubrobacteraceae bacterium]|jgi:hypothetical protein
MRGILLSGAVLVALAAPSAASACTIAEQPAKERVAEADVAVYGKIVAREKMTPAPDERPGADYRYRFRVIETYKGKIRKRMTLLGTTDSAACGPGLLDVGSKFGLVLNGGAPWRISAGSFITRSQLRSVRRPKRG